MNDTMLAATEHAVVYLVDDDPGALESLKWLLEAAEFSVQAFRTGGELLAQLGPDPIGCIIADICMPEIDGLALQRELASRRVALPIIFVTGQGDVSSCSRAYREGAFDFMEKPVDNQSLVNRVDQAIEESRRRRAARPANLEARIRRLTAREQQVMQRLVAGKSVKQIAAELEISGQTTAKHRANVHRKMRVDNDVELARLTLLSGE